MSLEDLTSKLCGHWEGEYQLWLNPNSEPQKSKSVASITNKIGGHVLHFEYDWEYDNSKCEGLLMVSYDEKRELVIISWIDSWHQKPEFMISQGTINDEMIINVKGSYRVSKGPNWEWRTKIILESQDEFIFEMYNITPDGQEVIAVKVEYKKLLDGKTP